MPKPIFNSSFAISCLFNCNDSAVQGASDIFLPNNVEGMFWFPKSTLQSYICTLLLCLKLVIFEPIGLARNVL